MLPPTVHMKTAHSSGSDDDQNFIQNLALFLCTFLKEHAQLIEKKTTLHPLLINVC